MKPITNTFVVVASDCPTPTAVVPMAKAESPTIAVIQYELLTGKPYAMTLEDLIFATHVRKLGLSKAEMKSQADAIRAALFAKSHPCMRASPLPKRYGWGVHHDSKGLIALYAAESPEYRHFAAGGDGVEVVPAMRSKRAG
ncbi:DUF6157 family protein [Limnoglobus roseus]|uniref:Uncharacterized protein n=1 Tax=Limnoglobus roseus TaxID=2598579 RepID=A0A5C1ABQ8_9BACT|nr:DUF6157 family protein [Limnoglobus roseus]QEL14584.1 hypothetical protein PX52LOC_01474 [Limnoglobus roseus]